MVPASPPGANRGGAGDGARGAYVACGRHAALAFLRARPGDVRRVLFAGDGVIDLDEATREALRGASFEAGSPRDLDRLAGGVPHQNLIAVGAPPPGVEIADVDPEVADLVLALDGLTDPRNVGAVLRTAAAAGVGAVVMARDRAPGLSPALVKAAAGAVEWVPIARVVNLARSLDALRDAGYWIVGLDGGGEHDLFAPEAVPGMPVVLVVGSEGGGLRPLTQRVCHRRVRIPMAGEVESLNVSVAAAVALFELRRRAGA